MQEPEKAKTQNEEREKSEEAEHLQKLNFYCCLTFTPGARKECLSISISRGDFKEAALSAESTWAFQWRISKTVTRIIFKKVKPQFSRNRSTCQWFFNSLKIRNSKLSERGERETAIRWGFRNVGRKRDKKECKDKIAELDTKLLYVLQSHKLYPLRGACSMKQKLFSSLPDKNLHINFSHYILIEYFSQ